MVFKIRKLSSKPEWVSEYMRWKPWQVYGGLGAVWSFAPLIFTALGRQDRKRSEISKLGILSPVSCGESFIGFWTGWSPAQIIWKGNVAVFWTQNSNYKMSGKILVHSMDIKFEIFWIKKIELAAKICTHSHLFTQNQLKLQNELQHVRPLDIIEHAAAYLFR